MKPLLKHTNRTATLMLTADKVREMDRHVLYFGDHHLKE